MEFVLETDSSVTWWKALELQSSSGTLIKKVETQDADHGPYSFSTPADDLVGARLTLAKAKMFGIHTGMYELQNLSAFPGRSFQFLWQRDDDKDGPVAGFFRDLGNGISAAANAVAEVVETVVEIVAEVISTVVEAIGTALGDVLNAIGNVLGGIPLIGGLLRGTFHWIATSVSAAFDLVATVIKAALDLEANVVAGAIRIVGGGTGGLLAWDGRLFVKGIGDFVSDTGGAVIAIVAKSVAVVQAVLFMQFGERSLTAVEQDMLRRVYRGSVVLYNVRVVEGFAGLFSTNTRPFTLGNKIYMKGVDSASDPAQLVHECCHVWQNQHQGVRYISDALWAQATIPRQGYSWEDELARGHFRWQDFNKEAQAKFLEDIFCTGRRIPSPSTHGEFYDDDPVGSNVKFEGQEGLLTQL